MTRTLTALTLTLGLAATALPAHAVPQDPFLFSRPAYPTREQPTSTAAADFDGDGRMDLASTVGTNAVSWGVGVMLGRQRGFAQPTLAPNPAPLLRILAVDANGDDRPDVLASHDEGDGTLTGVAMAGFGDGTLGEPESLPFPPYRAMAVGRFTSAGASRPGAVVAAEGGLSYWRPGPGPSFGYVRDHDVSSGEPTDLQALDMEGDGQDEVATIVGDTIRLLRDLTTAATVTLPGARSLDAADVTGDGHPELLAMAGNGEIKVYGPSLNVVRIAQPTQPGSAATAGDLNGDGSPDVVRVNDSYSLSVFWAGGGRTDVPLARPAIAAFVHDATGDGHADLLAVEGSSSLLEVVEGDGAGGFSPQRGTIASNPNGWWTDTADFNGDGKLDVISAQLNTNFIEGYLTFSTATVLLSGGDGTFTRAGTVSTDGTSTGFDVGDVNGDGKADVVVTDYHSGTVSEYLGNGDGTFGQRIYVPGCPLNDGVVSADFNDDGYADAAAACRETIFQQTLSIYLGSPAGLVPGITLGLSHSNLPWALRTGDINGDGNEDILLDSNQSFKPCAPPCTLIESSYDGALTYFLGLGNGLFEPEARDYLVGRVVGDSWIADVTGDGRGDVLTTIPYDEQVQIAPGRADGTLGTPFSIDVLEYPLGLRAADLTGDGKPDLVMTHGPNLISVTPGNGDGTFGTPTAYTARSAPGTPAIGRFDGDARLDLFAPEGGVAEVLVQGV
ncbi:MAG TPA: VCBS repeat-containing protein [Actinomycetota bacterium]